MLWFTALAVWCVSGYAQSALPAPPTAHDKPFYPTAAHARHFEQFKVTYNKLYPTPEEERYRFNVFKKNLATINELNANDENAVYDINETADQSDEEIKARYIHVHKRNTTNECAKIIFEEDFSAVDDAPDSFDWRNKGAVTKVKDQKNCNAGYAFAHVGAIEGSYAINFGKLIEFSTQQVIDCDTYDNGCKGGDPLLACGYLGINGFIKEENYKYVGSEGHCAYDKKLVVDHYKACLVVRAAEEVVTGSLLRHGPLAALIDNQAIRFYSSGIITKCTFKEYNDALLLTGYGNEKGIPFWSLKNSKGENWGEKGYVRIKRGVSCLGIAGKDKLSTVLFKLP